jgi:hypothetical protein
MMLEEKITVFLKNGIPVNKCPEGCEREYIDKYHLLYDSTFHSTEKKWSAYESYRLKQWLMPKALAQENQDQALRLLY